MIINDTTGHQTLELTQDETMSESKSQLLTGLCDGVMVTPEQITIDWNTVARVTIMRV